MHYEFTPEGQTIKVLIRRFLNICGIQEKKSPENVDCAR
jgi:hypothetical protein